MIVNGLALLADPPIKEMFHDKRNAHGVSYGLSEAGYDVRIKQDVTFIPGDYVRQVPPQVQLLCPHSQDPGRIDDGNFCIASTMEYFNMPAELAGEVKDKSTWARHGLSVFNTVIEPGWHGYLTLELVYHGRKPLHIPAGSGIAQVLFYRVSNPARYDGKYQGQGDRPVEPILTTSSRRSAPLTA
jgi:dCTP deaminase